MRPDKNRKTATSGRDKKTWRTRDLLSRVVFLDALLLLLWNVLQILSQALSKAESRLAGAQPLTPATSAGLGASRTLTAAPPRAAEQLDGMRSYREEELCRLVVVEAFDLL